MSIEKDQIITLTERKGNRSRKTKVIDVQSRFVVVKDIDHSWFKESLLLVDIENDLHPIYEIMIG
ncbi:hypothetical protein [Ammoniphilus sp. 3BR4]|uniref:hypothetical protein n=1 Tax=Ammoniphilus sp. 3BR4 TaxID=3158265 RepID=UPI003467CB3B